MAAAFLTLAWLLPGAVQDWRSREVSHGWIELALLFGLLWRLTGHGVGSWWEVWVILFLLAWGYQCRWVGGADVKATLAIALLSVPLSVWAWAGLVSWALALRFFYKKEARLNLPGLVGFTTGVIAWLVLNGLVYGKA
jgi:Flp pilus assembly protein protease CpaA